MSISLYTVRYVFDDLLETSEKMLDLQSKCFKHIEKLNDLAGSFNSKHKRIAFNSEVTICIELLNEQVDNVNNYYKQKDHFHSMLTILTNLRKELIDNRRFLFLMELELYALRHISKVRIAQVLGLPIRTIENHIVKLNEYINNMEDIPVNRVCNALREANRISQALTASENISGVPDSVQKVISSEPSDLFFKYSESELESVIKRIYPYTGSNETYELEKILLNIKNRKYEPFFIKRLNLMKDVSSFYDYFGEASKIICDYYQQYTDYIYKKRHNSEDAILYEAYVASPGKGYPQIAVECSVTVYKLRKVVKIYDKDYIKYRREHNKK